MFFSCSQEKSPISDENKPQVTAASEVSAGLTEWVEGHGRSNTAMWDPLAFPPGQGRKRVDSQALSDSDQP